MTNGCGILRKSVATLAANTTALGIVAVPMKIGASIIFGEVDGYGEERE